jgi:hypothetical protein
VAFPELHDVPDDEEVSMEELPAKATDGRPGYGVNVMVTLLDPEL